MSKPQVNTLGLRKWEFRNKNMQKSKKCAIFLNASTKDKGKWSITFLACNRKKKQNLSSKHA